MMATTSTTAGRNKRPYPAPDGASIVSSSIANEPQQKKLRGGREITPSPPAMSVIGIDLFTYFRKLPHDSDFDTIFKDPVVVLTLFRSLDNVEKTIVLRLLSLPEPSRWEPFLFWLGGNRKEVIRTLNTLCSLHILVIRPQRPSSASSASRAAGGSQNQAPGVRRPNEDVVRSREGTTSSSSSATASASSTLSAGSRSNSTATGGGCGIADARYELHQAFKQSLQSAFRPPVQSLDPLSSTSASTLSLTSSSSSSSAHSKIPKHFPTKHTLHCHATTQWNNIFSWLCEGVSMSKWCQPQSNPSSSSHRQQPLQSGHPVALSGDLLTVLTRLRLSNLPSIREESHLTRTSPNGLPNETFQWLLLDIRSQMLSIVIEYLHCLHFNIIGDGGAGAGVPSSLATSTPASAEKAAKDRTEVLCVLFALSEMPIGHPCSVNALSPVQVRFLRLAYDIGLIWMHKPREAKHYFPTPFAKLLQCEGPDTTRLTSAISTMITLGNANSESALDAPVVDLPSHLYHSAYTRFSSHGKTADYPLPEYTDSCASSSAEIQGSLTSTNQPVVREAGVIVESNFKVFAHTASSLLMTVVERLCDIRVVTPNLVIGTLSRDSFLEVYKSGVTADQIIRFFSTHAHPSIYAKSQREDKPVIPENVTTQLKIWEAERRRVQVSSACIFEFAKESDLDIFPLSVAKAISADWLLMNTEMPSSSNPNSKEFQDWKAKLIEKFKERPVTGELHKTPYAVLAIKAQHKDEMTAFIRSSMRNFKR